MKIEDVKTDALKRADDNELYVMRLRFVQLYNKNFLGNDRMAAGELQRSDLLDKYRLLVHELKHRGLRYEDDKPIDRAVFRKAMFGIDVRDLGDLVVVPDYMCIGGSFVKNPVDADDVDVVVRDHADNRDEGIELKVARTLKAKTGKDAHFVYAPRGPHSTYVPMYDLVLRAKAKMERVAVDEKRVYKADKGVAYYDGLDAWDMQLLEDNWNVVRNLASGSVLDLGCGTGRLLKLLQQSGVKVAGVDNDRTALRWCRKRGLDVQDVNLEEGQLPYDSNSWDNVIMVHTLEHVKNARRLLREAERVAKERVLVLVPLGQRYDMTHKHRFRNAEDVRKLIGDHVFYGVHVVERTNTALAVHDPKALHKARALTPFGSYDPPKPTMAGLTEAYSVDELANWAKGRTMVVEPKLNGFRMVLAKEGDTVKVLSESRDNHAAKYPSVVDVLRKVSGDFLLDCSMGIERNGKPLPRIELMTLLAAKPQLQADDRIVCTVFDLPYDGEDLHEQPFTERRKRLEAFYNKHLKGSPHFDLVEPSVTVNSLAELQAKFRQFAKLPQSEGVVVKDVNSKWSLDGSEPDWAKLKIEAEIKVQVLEAHAVKGGKHVYTCGLLLGDAEYTNTKEMDGAKLVVLGKTFATDVSASPGDVLTVGVEELIPRDNKLVWLGPRVLDKDTARKQPYAAAQAVDVARRANVLQVTKGKGKGIYLVAPHGTMIADEEKRMIVKLRPLPEAYVGTDVYLVEDKQVLGIVNLDKPKEITQQQFKEHADEHRITEEEAAKWGFDAAEKLLAYTFKVVEVFDPPVGYDPPPGVQTVIAEVDIEKAEREGAVGERGNVDFAEGDKGTGVLQAHVMGIEEEKVAALREASTRLLVARMSPAKLQAALKSVVGEQGLHCDLRLRPAGKDYWEGGEIMVGNVSGLTKLDKLKQENQKLRFGWKVSRAGEQQANIVRGPLSWMEAGKRKVEVFEPGSVGATANTYGALINLDTFNWQLYMADEHAKKFRITDGKLLEGNFLFAYVPVAEGGRVWMVSRLKDTDHVEATKAQAAAVQKCEYCDVLAVKSHMWSEGIGRDSGYIATCEQHNQQAMQQARNQGLRIIRSMQIESGPIPVAKLSPAQRKECDEETEHIKESAKTCIYPHKFRAAKYTHPNGHPRCVVCGQEQRIGNVCRRPVAKALVLQLRIYKMVKSKQIVGGVVYEPMVEDTQGDYASEEEIQAAMYRFMEKYARDVNRIKVQHKGKRYTFPILECFQPEHDIQRGGKTVKKGSWWLMLKVTDPEVWQLVESGKLTAFSMGGVAAEA